MWQWLAWAVSMAAALTLVALGAQAGRNGACADGGSGRGGQADATPRHHGDADDGPVRRHEADGMSRRADRALDRARSLTGWARGGNCSLSGAVLGDLVAAVSAEEYAGSAACGAYLDVTGPRGTVRVQVIDECLSCAPGELDLSRAAFARVAGPGPSMVPISYHTVQNPLVPRPVAFRLKKGSSTRWLAIQAVDHGNPLQRLEVLHKGRWRALSRHSDNYWVAHRGIGSGPYTVRITDVYGQRLIATGIDLAPEGLQRTPYRLYAPAKASPVPRNLPSSGRNGTHGSAGGARPRSGTDGTLPAPAGRGTTGPATAAPGTARPPALESESAKARIGGMEFGTSGPGTTGARGLGFGRRDAWPERSQGHAAGGTLDTYPDGPPLPDADPAPFTALPSARPFFC
ncbi:hypothetical protein GCM10022226_79950 [Sphaerisporangium flaviroseum]|uniref:Expansin-like EG45 domain-containing protein n=1 Tax=Sphaerisporangium flaviroseum TaxID=509199 RepID=A0ABP7JHQ8_9ACTN